MTDVGSAATWFCASESFKGSLVDGSEIVRLVRRSDTSVVDIAGVVEMGSAGATVGSEIVRPVRRSDRSVVEEAVAGGSKCVGEERGVDILDR